MADSCCAGLQGRLASGEHVFGPLLQKYLLGNPHKISVRVLPDKQLAAQQEAAEKDRLQQRMQAMSQQDIQAAVKETAELKHRQVKPPPPHPAPNITHTHTQAWETNAGLQQRNQASPRLDFAAAIETA